MHTRDKLICAEPKFLTETILLRVMNLMIKTMHVHNFNLEVFAEHINYSLIPRLLDVFKRLFPAMVVLYNVQNVVPLDKSWAFRRGGITLYIICD